MGEGVTNESKSYPLVHGSWKYAWSHWASKSARDAYPLVSLFSFCMCHQKITKASTESDFKMYI